MSDAFDEVELDSRNPVVLRQMLLHDVPRIVATGRLYRPPPSFGPGPFPAMVLVHGLGGMKKNRELRYGAWLASLGVVALLVDSYSCRGMAKRPDVLRALAVTESMFLADAFAALEFLSRHAKVDPSRVGIMGFSYGGMVAALAAYRQIQEIYAPDGHAFAGHISFYGCSVARLKRVETTGAPVLIMNGALDRNVSTERWREIAGDLRAGGSHVDLHNLAGTYHQWDGDDLVRRRKLPALHRLAVTVGPDCRVRDERFGWEMKGFLSRALVIAGGVDWRGYHILRNDEHRRFSDALVRAFISNNLKEMPFSSAAG